MVPARPLPLPLFAVAAILLAAALPHGEAAPPTAPAPPPRRDTAGSRLTDAQVVDSMKKGIDFLLKHKSAPDNWEAPDEREDLRGGRTALVLYALLHAGESLDDEDISKTLKDRSEELAPAVKFLAGIEAKGTYPVGLQADALTMFAHTPDTTPALKRDRDYLVDAMGVNGGYSYKYFLDSPGSAHVAALKHIEQIRAQAVAARARGDNATVNALAEEFKKATAEADRTEAEAKNAPGIGNLSCAQYGALGAWALADDGMEFNLSYWKTTDKFFRQCQQADGSWNYLPDGHGDGQRDQVRSMTAAGLATLYVAAEFTDSELRLEPREDKAITNGLARLVADFDPTIANFYYLYGVERVGLASGLKFLGTTDWYREGAANIISTQQPEGDYAADFTGACPTVSTAYALLFLARGRNPIAFNKLQYNGPWNARPRDDANITRWMSKQFERPINWQSVNLNVDPEEWTDAPVLLITGSKDPKFTDADLAKLRAFINAGGIIFSSADGSAPAFTEACMRYASKVVDRRYEFRALPPDHVLYSADQWTKIINPPRLLGLSNGIRELWIHSTVDLGASWQMHRVASKEHFEVPANIYFYAAGKGMLHSRLRSLAVAEAKDNPARTIAVGRLEYPGNWDPEPGAWPRFAKLAAVNFHTALNVASIKPAALDPAKFPLVHMTGSAPFTFPAEDAGKLKDYIAGGGTLFVDAGGGNAKFIASFNDLVKATFPDAALEPIPGDDALLAGKLPDAIDTQKIELRRYAMVAMGDLAAPKLLGLKHSGRWAIIFSPIDISSGFLSTNTGGITGYTPDSSQNLARDIVLYAAQLKSAATEPK